MIQIYYALKIKTFSSRAAALRTARYSMDGDVRIVTEGTEND
jgi:hypothetical protein